jgi:uncharacterized protein YndB with AHSA1/START domain
METPVKNITVMAMVNAPIARVWEYFTEPTHITKWNFASDDWHCPKAENNLSVGGAFNYRMEARDGSFGFDFGGIYNEVKPNLLIAYTMGDGRKVSVTFASAGDQTNIVETFEAETQNPIEMQKAGWQSILDNFKKFVEGN